ncbi:MAG: hypothetical protein FD153_636 [Rhodospirillaceae bacterium]|nr:MAG: hypothetical protein FD153_636 [Rhodospirillaceae bacterium]
MFSYLDRFKNINDTPGYQAGGQVLWEAARWLERCLNERCVHKNDTSIRLPGIVARLLGDEFTILIEGVRNTETVAPWRRARRSISSRNLMKLIGVMSIFMPV